jgi:anti-anti-sigma factor
MTTNDAADTPGQFSADVACEDRTCRLRLSGELDIAALPAAGAALERAFAQDWELLVVDLAPLSFLDSSGLRFVTEVHERSRSADRRISISPGPPAVQRVFELTGMDAVLPFEA